jgi:ribonuclease-3
MDLTSLEQQLGYHFKDKNLLLQALTHTTFAYESQQENLSDNQRLEFLGDSILTMVTAEYLYKKYPECSEGELTHRRALVVNRGNLAKKAKEINLSQYLLLGKGEEKLGGRENSTNLSCALEAIIGAIYLDAGFKQAQRFIRQMII